MLKPMHFYLVFGIIALLLVFAESAKADGDALTSGHSAFHQLTIADDIKRTDFHKFSQMIQQLVDQKEQLSSEERQYLAYLRGYYYAFTGQYEQSSHWLYRAIQNSVNDKLKVKSKNTLLNVYVVKKNYLAAFLLANELLLQVSSLSDPELKAHTYLSVSLLFNNTGLNDEALFHLQSIFDLPEQSAQILCAATQVQLEANLNLRAFEQLEAIMAENERECALAADALFLNIARVFFSRYLLIEQEYDKALQLLSDHYPQVLEVGYPMLVASFEALLAQAYLKMGHLEEARKYGLLALSNANFSEFNQAKIFAYETLYLIEFSERNFENALTYFEALSLVRGGYQHEQSEQQVAYHLARAQVQTKNQQIELLSKDNQLLHLQQRVLSQEAQNARLLLGVFFLLLIVLSIFAYHGLMGRHRFKFMAENDELTGISNRYHFNKQAERSLKQCQKQGLTAGVILFDLDHFKQINDQFGHATGDWVLQQVVQSCRNFMRIDDVFGRLGGEEFAILLPNCHADKALMLAEICRDSIEEIQTRQSGHEFLLTASFGVTSSDSSGYELKQLLSDADKAMYQAKQGGRNQVQFFSGA